MNNVTQLYRPQWNLCGNEWHLVSGNKLVAKLVPNFCEMFPKYKWISVIEPEFESFGWHAVDFQSLDAGKFDLEHWWLFLCQGERYEPHTHCRACREGLH